MAPNLASVLNGCSWHIFADHKRTLNGRQEFVAAEFLCWHQVHRNYPRFSELGPISRVQAATMEVVTCKSS